MKADDLRQAMQDSPAIRICFLHFAQAFMVQAAHTAVANGRGKLEERLARWLLMAHDRVEGNELPLTHEFIALMLNVRRAGVTEATAGADPQRPCQREARADRGRGSRRIGSARERIIRDSRIRISAPDRLEAEALRRLVSAALIKRRFQLGGEHVPLPLQLAIGPLRFGIGRLDARRPASAANFRHLATRSAVVAPRKSLEMIVSAMSCRVPVPRTSSDSKSA